MRLGLLLIMILLAGCRQSEPEPERGERSPVGRVLTDPRSGQSRVTIGTGDDAVELQSGVTVPVRLPDGITLYSGSQVIANSQVERGGRSLTLLVFDTDDRLPDVLKHYRQQFMEAGFAPVLDIDGGDRASLAGRGAGWDMALTARQRGDKTRVELSAGPSRPLASPVDGD